MCLYPKQIRNKHYLPNKSNNFKAPILTDKRLEFVNAECGKCIECRKKKQREWITRLSEEIRTNKGIFVTLTFNNEHLAELEKNTWGNPNKTAKKALRLFLERIRKQTKKSVKHWCITELGEENDRIHIHGIFFCNEELIKKHWYYGHTFIGTYVNEKTIRYITKYILKYDEKHPTFKGKILCSAGIGNNYMKRLDAKNNGYIPHETNETYRLKDGRKIYLPQYYRRKIYTAEEREALWIEKIEKGDTWIMGEKVKKESEEEKNLIQYYRRIGIELYKENPEEWEKQKKEAQKERYKEYKRKQTNNV